MGFFDRFVRAVSSAVETVTAAIGDALGLRDSPSAPVDVPDVPTELDPEPPSGGGFGGAEDELGSFGESLSDVLGPPDEAELGDRSPDEIEMAQWISWAQHNRGSFNEAAYAQLLAILQSDEWDLDDMGWSNIDYESDSDT